MTPAARTLVKIVVSAALMAWLLTKTPIGDIASQLGRLSATALALGAALSIAAWLVGAVRLWLLVPDFALREIVRMSFISLFYATVFPGQLAGDAVKAWRLARSQRDVRHDAAAATVIDRWMAVLTLLALGAIASAFADVPALLRDSFVLSAIVVGFGGIVLSLAPVRRTLVSLLESHRVAMLSRMTSTLASLVDASHLGPRAALRLAGCLSFALVFHALCLAIHVVIGRDLGLDLSLAQWSVVYAGVSMLVLLPISIAGIGLREGGYVGMLGLFATPRETALAISLVFLAYGLLGALIGLAIELMPRSRNGLLTADESAPRK